VSLTTCWHCGESIYPVNDTWETTEGIKKCYSGPDDQHAPVPVKSENNIKTITDGIREHLMQVKERGKYSLSSSSSYCAGCHNVFPSSMGFPHTQSGETLIYCPRCKDNGMLFGEQDGFFVSAGIYYAAPALDLECDKCGEELDTGDDNETDMFGGVGETCPNCNQGKLKMANSRALDTQDSYEDSSLLQADDMSALTPDVAEGIRDITNAPRTFKAPRKMTREQVSGLDANGDGIYPRSYKIASYEDMRNHLVQHHNFKNDWLTGYSEKDLLHIYDAAHKHGAYAADHEHPVYDYVHGTMITSSKTAGEIIQPPASYWNRNNDDSENPKSITLINPNNRHDWSPMSPFHQPQRKRTEFEGYNHEQGEFNPETWHYKPAGMYTSNHGSYEKFYGTVISDHDTNIALDAVTKLIPAFNMDGNRCKECGSSHGWKWEMHIPKQRFLAGSGLEPLSTYDQNGKKQKVEGFCNTRKDAVLQSDQAHQREFVDPLKESNIDFNK
jgi:hypothetical protein